MPQKRPNKALATVKIFVGVLLALVELSSNNHGLVKPDNSQAIGFDLWGAAVYLLCVWAVVTGFRSVMRKPVVS